MKATPQNSEAREQREEHRRAETAAAIARQRVVVLRDLVGRAQAEAGAQAAKAQVQADLAISLAAQLDEALTSLGHAEEAAREAARESAEDLVRQEGLS